MIVNVEFLGSEPIENVITALNFKIDKTIFFGYEETIRESKNRTDKFLKKYCGVDDIEYFAMSHTDIDSVIKLMRAQIEKEYSRGNEVFFDITGGESLILVAFGMIASERNTPIHMYDIEKNKLIEYAGSDKTGEKLSNRARSHIIKMNIEKYIEMYGGIVNRKLHKSMKNISDEALTQKIDALWEIMIRHKKYWNSFSHVMKVLFKPDDYMGAYADLHDLKKMLNRVKLTDDSLSTFRKIISELGHAGILRDVTMDESVYSFRYDSGEMQYYLWDCGSILEFHTYSKFADSSDDCRIGVHIDWDGVINYEQGADVLNEIDVLLLNGYIPTFISCKSGKMGPEKSLHALYELETVATRFGKKYAKKVLVLTETLSDTHQMRADEMNIEIIVEN